MTYKETKTGVKKSQTARRHLILKYAAKENKENWQMKHKPYAICGKAGV